MKEELAQNKQYLLQNEQQSDVPCPSSPLLRGLGEKQEEEQGECQRWLPLAPGLASDPLCLAQDACDLLAGIRIAVWSDVTIY